MKSTQGLLIFITLLFIILFHFLLVFMCKSRGTFKRTRNENSEDDVDNGINIEDNANLDIHEHCPFNQDSKTSPEASTEEELLNWLQSEGDSIYASVESGVLGHSVGNSDNSDNSDYSDNYGCVDSTLPVSSNREHPLQKRIDASLILPEIPQLSPDFQEKSNNVTSWNNSVSYAPIL